MLVPFTVFEVISKHFARCDPLAIITFYEQSSEFCFGQARFLHPHELTEFSPFRRSGSSSHEFVHMHNTRVVIQLVTGQEFVRLLARLLHSQLSTSIIKMTPNDALSFNSGPIITSPIHYTSCLPLMALQMIVWHRLYATQPLERRLAERRILPGRILLLDLDPGVILIGIEFFVCYRLPPSSFCPSSFCPLACCLH